LKGSQLSLFSLSVNTLTVKGTIEIFLPTVYFCSPNKPACNVVPPLVEQRWFVGLQEKADRDIQHANIKSIANCDDEEHDQYEIMMKKILDDDDGIMPWI
jgi:hypothetical protein